MITVNCPNCGREIEAAPRPDHPGRLEARCVCWPTGPVLEFSAPADDLPVVAVIDERDGISDAEASAAGRALSKRKERK